MKLCFTVLFFLSTLNLFAQTTFETSPQFPTQTDNITIEFDVTKQTDSRTLVGYTGNVFAHTGVYFNNDRASWKNVIGNWGNNSVQPQLTSLGSNKYKIVIDNPRNFYNVANESQVITTLNFVLRSSDGTKQTEDIFVPIYSSGISIVFNSPQVNVSFGDPMRSPVFVSAGGSIPISVSTAEVGTTTKSINLYVNGIQKAQSTTNSLYYTFLANEYNSGKNEIKIVAADITTLKDSATFVIMKNPEVKNLPLPSGSQIGVNYNTKVLALYAPHKKFVYLIGDHSDWKVDPLWFMNRDNSTPDSLWWINFPSTTEDPSEEISYQFLIDGVLRIFDPYTDKILDPWNDSSIPYAVYPNLKPYPSTKTENVVSVLQPVQTNYKWKVESFNRPSKEKLVIYELLIRDFVNTHSYKTLIDTLSYFKKLGVNAIELMPVSEFEGNNSWGYNPMTYFAPDKYYGTKNDLKAFIDACHQNGIAVIMDMVLNHAYGSNSMVRMYWDGSKPAANNPWFNQVSPNPTYSWGYDFNHESAATKYFVDRVTSYWLKEYKVDGFRFDFTKGFTNTPGEGTPYDPARITILKRMADKIWNASPNAYVILEHFCTNSEELELANYGMMVWGNQNYSYNEATMGFVSTSNFNNVSFLQRSWSSPNLVGYMESHDEERLMFKNITYGNSSGSYNIKNLNTALNRMKLASAFFIPVPGPKMIWQFGELGYDYSINYPSGTSNDRLTPKPIRWDYFSNSERKSLFNTIAALIRIKKYYPAFSSMAFSLNASGSVKNLLINHSSMNVAIIGNFDVSVQNGSPTFQNTGKWYEFFSGDSLNVSDVNMTLTLQPGEYRLYTSKKIMTASVLVDVKPDKNKIPAEFSLMQNYPNPFNPSTIISWQIAVSSYVTLKVYDMLGREVATLVDEFQQAGIHNSTFNITNLSLTSGVYYYTLRAGNYIETKKMVLIK
jgi:pullulanase/glycogen debranching enzyme